MTIVFSSYNTLTEVIVDLETLRQCDSDSESEADSCDDGEVSAAAALTSSYVFLIESVCSLLVVGSLGSLSDRVGRRPLLALAVVGTLVESLGVVAVVRLRLPSLYLLSLIHI